MTSEVKDLLKKFKLINAEGHLDELLPKDQAEREIVLKNLKVILERESDFCGEKLLKKRMDEAEFPEIKTIGGFDFEAQPSIKKKDIDELMKMKWVDNSFNILFFGPPGVGKTHLATGLGVQAIQMGYTVYFTEMDNLIKILKKRDASNASKQRYKRIITSKLLIIDEIGYSPVTPEEVNLFFQLIRSINGKTSIIITSNKEFSKWTEFMDDKAIAAAILDRLMYRCQVFSLKGEISYRMTHRETIFPEDKQE